MSLFAVKNDNGKWLNVVGRDGLWGANGTGIATKEQAEARSELFGGTVVEMIEKPEPVVVSEEEAKMLKKAKNTTVWRPASVIERYACEHERQADDEVLLEVRLMRAYVNGYTVEKPNRWNVKVKYAQDSYYYKTHVLGKPIVRAFQIAGGNKLDDRAAFTLSEIERYGLQDCERVEVTDDEQ